MQGTATGGVALTGGGTDRTLALGTGGIEILNGAGPVAIGSRATGQAVAISMTGNQTWTNGSANAVIVQNGIGAIGAHTLALRGAGGFRLNGPGTYTGVTTLLSSTIGIGNDTALGTGTFTVQGGTILVEDFPRTLANKVRINNAASTWSGEGALTLIGSGATPAITFAQYANPSFTISRTAPMIISGVYSLLDASSGSNNSGVGPRLASGADVVITGEIRDNNAGNAASNPLNNGIGFTFLGTGGNLTVFGNNAHGAATPSGSSASILAQSGSGFNTVTVGGPGGPGATITPFGATVLSSNSGQGFYLKALESGQVLGNGISLGASTNNDGGRPVGFAGENDLTLGGAFALGKTIAFPNLATGTLTFGATLNAGTLTFTILGSGNTVFSASSTIVGTTGSLAKTGPGALTLAGLNNLTGTSTFNGGTVILDFSAANANRLTQGTTATALTLGGTDLQLKGGSHAQALGAGGGTTLGLGQSRVRRTAGGTSTIALGAIARGAGGLVDFENRVATTTSGNTSGILGTGYATVGGTDWATVSGGSIVGLASYGTFAAPGTDQNVSHTGSAALGTTTIRTVKLATSGSGQALTMSGILTVNNNGLLFLGSDDYSINGYSVTCSGGLTIHHFGNGVLTIDSRVSGGAVQKGGPGRLVLTCVTNNYTTTYLLDGTVSVHDAGCLGTGNLSFSGGTLESTAGFVLPRSVALGANGGTFQVDTGTLEVTNLVSGAYGPLFKTGAGTLLLSGTNTYSGPTTVSAGTLKLGHDFGLGPCATNNNRSISPVTVTGASTLDIAGRKAAIGNFTLADGTVADSVGGGTLGAYSFNVQNGTVSAILKDVTVPSSGNPGNSINLYKRTAGTVTLTADNLYSGSTFVEAGSLFVNGSSTSPAIVQDGATLGGNGTLSRTVNVEGGTLAPGASAAQPGTLTLGRHLRIAGGTLRVGIDGAAHGQVALTNPEARVILEDAALDVVVLSGGSTGELTLFDNAGTSAIEGTFTDLPEGGIVESGSKRFVITYQGGDGNDVVLAAKQTATLILVR